MVKRRRTYIMPAGNGYLQWEAEVDEDDDSPMSQIFREYGEVAAEFKAWLGHSDHDGWRTTEHGLHCGCGMLMSPTEERNGRD